MTARYTSEQVEQMATDYAGGMTHRQIAERYGGTHVTVGRTLRRCGVAARSATQSRALTTGSGIHDENELIRLYRDEYWNIAPLARHFQVKNQAVSEVLHRHGITMRPGGVTHQLFNTDEKCEALAAEYRKVGSIHVLAERYGCTAPTIVRALDRVGQPSIAKGREAPFSVQQGVSGSAYGPSWPRIREEIIECDDHRCISCGHPEHDRTRKLTAAHLVPATAHHDLEQANHLDNLVTLCTRCHRAFDGNHYTEWKPSQQDRTFWPAWARRHSCGDCGSSNVVSVPLAGPVS